MTFELSWWCDDCRKKRFEKHNEKKKPSNADRIRAMSDEELAASHLIIPCFYDDDGYGECKFGWHERKQTCEECKLEWLKQPAE
jgi:hypothetical protein